MNPLIPQPLVDTLMGRRTKYLPSYSYKLDAGGRFGMDLPMGNDPADIDENAMSVWISFASGARRDGVGDLLEVGGIDTSRHQMNPIVLFDHGKSVFLPVALTEEPRSHEYMVQLDTMSRVARAKAFFYQGKSEPFENEYGELESPKRGDHFLFCEQLFDLIAKRYVRAGSIGYQVVKAMPLPPDYMTGTPQGLHLINTLLLEVSAVVMPANADTVRKALSMPRICGKPLSPMLVKSLSPYAGPRKAQLGYEGKGGRTSTVRDNEYEYNNSETGGNFVAGNAATAMARAQADRNAAGLNLPRNPQGQVLPHGLPTGPGRNLADVGKDGAPNIVDRRTVLTKPQRSQRDNELIEGGGKSVPVPHGNHSKTDYRPARWKPGLGAMKAVDKRSLDVGVSNYSEHQDEDNAVDAAREQAYANFPHRDSTGLTPEESRQARRDADDTEPALRHLINNPQTKSKKRNVDEGYGRSFAEDGLVVDPDDLDEQDWEDWDAQTAQLYPTPVAPAAPGATENGKVRRASMTRGKSVDKRSVDTLVTETPPDAAIESYDIRVSDEDWSDSRDRAYDLNEQRAAGTDAYSPENLAAHEAERARTRGTTGNAYNAGPWKSVNSGRKAVLTTIGADEDPAFSTVGASTDSENALNEGVDPNEVQSRRRVRNEVVDRYILANNYPDLGLHVRDDREMDREVRQRPAPQGPWKSAKSGGNKQGLDAGKRILREPGIPENSRNALAFDEADEATRRAHEDSDVATYYTARAATRNDLAREMDERGKRLKSIRLKHRGQKAANKAGMDEAKRRLNSTEGTPEGRAADARLFGWAAAFEDHGIEHDGGEDATASAAATEREIDREIENYGKSLPDEWEWDFDPNLEMPDEIDLETTNWAGIDWGADLVTNKKANGSSIVPQMQNSRGSELDWMASDPAPPQVGPRTRGRDTMIAGDIEGLPTGPGLRPLTPGEDQEIQRLWHEQHDLSHGEFYANPDDPDDNPVNWRSYGTQSDHTPGGRFVAQPETPDTSKRLKSIRMKYRRVRGAS